MTAEAYDVLGRQVARRDIGQLGAGPQRVTLQLPDLPAGAYVLVVTARSTGQTHTATTRLTVVR